MPQQADTRKDSLSELGQPVIRNRIRQLLVHTPWYMIEGQARLAADCGVSPSAISRLVTGRASPSYRLVVAITRAFSERLGKPIDARDIFTTDGTFPEPSACRLCECRGCFPDEAYDRHGNLTDAYKNARPGDWSLSPPLPGHGRNDICNF
jgi:transcriptional regulator with XRE-family HTH domain